MLQATSTLNTVPYNRILVMMNKLCTSLCSPILSRTPQGEVSFVHTKDVNQEKPSAC